MRLPLMPVVALAGPVLLVGCGAGGGGGTVVRDSAGVTLVENDVTRPAWGDRGWRVAEPPLLSVGDDESPEGYSALSGMTQAQLLPSDELVVADGQGAQVLVFGPDGAFRRSVGRRGEGPGEFRSPYSVAAHTGDSLVVFNLYRAVLVFDGEGRFGRSFLPDGRVGESQGVPKRTFGDGTLLFSQYQFGEPPSPGLHRSLVELVRVDLTGEVLRRYGLFEEQTYSAGTSQRYLYGPWGHMTAGPDAFWYSPGDRIDVERRDLEGNLTRRIRLPLPARPVTAADVEAEKAALLEQYQGRPEAVGIAMVYDNAITAPVFPAHGPLLVDDANHLWVSEYRPWAPRVATPWHVFDPDGRYLGAVVMPIGFQVDQIVGARVVGRYTDADGLPTARVYRIEGR